MSEHPEIAEHEWYTTHMEISELNKDALERGLALVRMARHSSQAVRGNLSFSERDSTWKVSLLTGQTVQHPNNLMEPLEVNYETD